MDTQVLLTPGCQHFVEVGLRHSIDQHVHLLEKGLTIIAQMHGHEGLLRFMLDDGGIPARPFRRFQKRPGDEALVFGEKVAGLPEPFPEFAGIS